MSSFEYEIKHTGSTGNCAIITVDGMRFMIDFGKSFKTINQYMTDIDFVLCTHVHGDHLNISSYKGIMQNYSHVGFITNQSVRDRLEEKGVDTLPENIVKAGDTIYIGDVEITVFDNEHGIECNGYIFKYNDEYLLFATDLSTTIWYQDWLDANNVKLDVCLLEANYDPQVIQFYEESKEHTGYNVFSNGSFRHLPTTENQEFIEKYLKPDGVSKELHISATYHDFKGLIRKSKGKITIEDVERWKQEN